MKEDCVINVDLADVWADTNRDKLIRTLAWGDRVTVTARTAAHLEVDVTDFFEQKDGSVLPTPRSGYIKPTATSKIKVAEVVRPLRENEVLKVNFVDVQQGDGAVIESPDGKVILVDGGDNQLFARYLAGRFRGTSLAKPQPIECILVSHGDADHFEGLPEILESETNKEPRKRLFIAPKRYFHNGIVKRPGKRGGKKLKDVELLGPTATKDNELYLTDLVDDLLAVPAAEMNAPFTAWAKTLKEYHRRSPLEVRRVAYGDDAAFDFFNQPEKGLKIEVLGPLTETVNGKPGLKFLGEPPKGPRIGQDSVSLGSGGFGGHDAGHTINGHSIVFRLSYGGFSYLFSGDLNDEASRFLAKQHRAKAISLKSDVFKVPHHGSADFSGNFIQCVAPVVSVVSSGDENERKEYIHPRATLMGALGRWARVAEPLIFVTELAAFFKVEGWSKLSVPKTAAEKKREFFGFSRAAFGIVKTRTDGKRLLVYVDSANLQMKEAYAYEAGVAGADPKPAVVRRA